ncbi:hypothetical protein TRVA0_002S00342 [Trichomonascus vanleenenianus]|uniref:uncharacterized protein n=1 Tax=Trichomonascus vanleenenianus TaxID=2268995 RepID=UPI003EC9AF88
MAHRFDALENQLQQFDDLENQMQQLLRSPPSPQPQQQQQEQPNQAFPSSLVKTQFQPPVPCRPLDEGSPQQFYAEKVPDLVPNMDVSHWIRLAKIYATQSKDEDLIKVYKLAAKVKWMTDSFLAIARNCDSNGSVNWDAFFARIKLVYPATKDNTQLLAELESLNYKPHYGSLAKFLDEEFLLLWCQIPSHMDPFVLVVLTSSIVPEEYRQTLLYVSKPEIGMSPGNAIQRYVAKAKELEAQRTKKFVKCDFCKLQGHTFQQCRARKTFQQQ